ncbi:hypothetical protein JCM16775_2037 [Leptotrichia hofstadii]|uniref:Uncharacterized protein n=2 Tax=Leptotrichia hofstadii TaxID=157688 RepID=C9N167_9FUSO|nr:hypothetical protein GCWU000323_02588 [Leptotrichia hofstadii F0254]BBM39326.1 hypothetical protein JCM16775_2037 [Leptotrichia hofstadii]
MSFTEKLKSRKFIKNIFALIKLPVMIKLKMLKQAGIVKGMASNPLYVFKKEKHKNYRKNFY